MITSLLLIFIVFIWYLTEMLDTFSTPEIDWFHYCWRHCAADSRQPYWCLRRHWAAPPLQPFLMPSFLRIFAVRCFAKEVLLSRRPGFRRRRQPKPAALAVFDIFITLVDTITWIVCRRRNVHSLLYRNASPREPHQSLHHNIINVIRISFHTTISIPSL